MKFFVTRNIFGLIPCSNTDYDKLQECKLKQGKIYEVEIKQKRNPKFHAKFFAMLNICFENQENYNNLDHLRHDLLVDAGYYTEVVDMHGEVTKRAVSISFAKMDDIEFNKVYNAVFCSIVNFIHVDSKDLEEEINTLLSGF